jgi:hypothetical protein
MTSAAAFTLMRAWFNGGIFAECREHVKAWRAGGRLPGELLLCPLCLVSYVCGILVLLFVLPSLFLPWPWSAVVKLPLYIFAAAALVPLDEFKPDE